jgi:protein ImuB
VCVAKTKYAKALLPQLQVYEDAPEVFAQALKALAEWCIRFSPHIATCGQDVIVINATGCAHLWGDEMGYINHIEGKLNSLGYTVHIGMASTLGAAWAVAHYAEHKTIVPAGAEKAALSWLPPEALRIEPLIAQKLHKLGLHYGQDFLKLPAQALRRRFGAGLLLQIQYALGYLNEPFIPLVPTMPYTQRLPCIEPITTCKGIEIAIGKLLQLMCTRLANEQNGLRTAVLKTYRVDGHCQTLEVNVNKSTCNTTHLAQLFKLKIDTIAPGLGIELFTLEALRVEKNEAQQEEIWKGQKQLQHNALAELVDKVAGKIGEHAITRYLPAEHYLPERSVKKAALLTDKPFTTWNTKKARPLFLLPKPQPIVVTAPIPDYPPMLFRHNNVLHKIIKADGPERIEQEWWVGTGRHRDYYYVEDEQGHRYWLFRSGHYSPTENNRWYLHGYGS